jgi:hypothetical protein
VKFGSLDLPVRLYNPGPQLWTSLLTGHLILLNIRVLILKLVNSTARENIGDRSRYTDGLQAGRPGFDLQQGKIFLLFLCSVQTSSGAHPASYPIDTETLSASLKRQGRETDHYFFLLLFLVG